MCAVQQAVGSFYVAVVAVYVLESNYVAEIKGVGAKGPHLAQRSQCLMYVRVCSAPCILLFAEHAASGACVLHVLCVCVCVCVCVRARVRARVRGGGVGQ